MQKVKEEVAKDASLSDEQVEATVKRIVDGNAVSVDSIEELLSVQAKALQAIATQSIPSNTQAILKRMDEEYENPYILVDDKIAVLTVSTIDLASIDGWPGYIEEKVVGDYTAQHLQKRIRIPLEVNYEPSLERRYTLVIMDKAEYDDMKVSSPGGTIPNASMISAISLRVGDGR